MKRIAIVEDDEFVRDELRDIFQKAGYEAVCITQFQETIPLLLKARANLIVLDLNLPGRNGFEICQEVKRRQNVPILVLTSADRLKDELHALELGADEYLTKPCNTARLLARTENLLKRFEGRENLLSGDGFLLDDQTYTLYADSQSVVLSEKEGQILKTLLLHLGEVVSKEELFFQLWGTNQYIDENALQVNMTRLRRSLKELGLGERIETVRGKGYRLAGGKKDESMEKSSGNLSGI